MAGILLGLLLVFYLGGRFILVHMIREAEKDIQVIGSDVKSVVYNELGYLQKVAIRAADAFSRSGGEKVTREFLHSQLGPFFMEEVTPVNLVIALAADGSFQKGCFQTPDTSPLPIEANEVLPYLAPLPSLLGTNTVRQLPSGLITFRQKPVFIGSAPLKNPSGKVAGFILTGSLFHTHPLLSRINKVTHGMQVAIAEQCVRHATGKERTPLPPTAGIFPVFSDALNFYSGGRWHLGENVFEAVIPIHDILGREVTSISIRLPQSFSSLASIALGWLTVFVASVGILFVLPIFWLQTRIVLNPLCSLAEQIRRIGECHLDGNCASLYWPHKDEFGMLAQSVNSMLDALSRKTKQVGQIEQRQRALIAGMPDGLCVFDANAHLVAVHKQPDYTHPIPGLITGYPVRPPLFPEADCETLRKAIGETFQTEKIQMVLVSCRESDNSYRHFETRICRMDAYFALVIFRDVTAEWRDRETRVQVEDRLAKIQKMESLGNLAAGIAHDVNNILAIIQNTVEATWENPDPETRAAVATIRQATGKGAALTRELMTYAGQTRITFKRDDPNSLVLDLEKLMGGVVAPNVSIELKLTPNLPPVDTDPQQFWKVIINLLKNASEAMAGSRGHIRISTYPLMLTPANIVDFFSTHALAPGNGVVFQIDDTGSGIPPEIIKRLFEPFFSTKAIGRGLGLATVFAIVDAHNGGIAIDSEQGKGTTFRIWIPAVKATRATLPQTPAAVLPATVETKENVAAAPVASVQKSPPRVLLIEDDPAILLSTSFALRSLNAETLTAATKREALSIFRKQGDSISLILLDAHIGHLDNVRLLSTLRLRNPNVPIVVISGYNESRIREMFASESYDGFLSKPYTRGELEGLLNRFASSAR
ncbi:MAG: ATP-binding protein [Kiritimatiellae bacterium]|nr:ATP-binding protein [Kiritimatiellia bacterium]